MSTSEPTCFLCNDTCWTTPYSFPSHGKTRGSLIDVWMPCSQYSIHGIKILPDILKIDHDARRRPTKDIDFVVIRDVCLAGNSAFNGRCGDLACVCAPSQLVANTRVWRIDPGSGFPDDVHTVCEDHGDTITVMPTERLGRIIIRTPKIGWKLVGIRPFPADDPRSEKAFQ